MAHGLKRKLDYSDLQAMPADGKRYELVEGGLLVTPSPRLMHQWVSKRLQRQMEDYFEERSIGDVFAAPVDVVLTKHDVFVPDLLVTMDRSDITKPYIERAPLLVVEILSPSTQKTDRGLKSRRYAELGVQHYWIVDPDAKRIECFRLKQGRFEALVEAHGGASLTHPDWNGLAIELAKLWR